MKSSPPQVGEKRGLLCPKCGDNLTHARVCKSYQSASGQMRTRVCRRCHTEVETIEAVVGASVEVLDVSNLDRDQVRMVRQMVTQLRRVNVTIDMPMKPRVLQLPDERA